MDLTSLIISIFLCALFVGPVVYATRIRKRKNKQFLNNFSDRALKHNISIKTFDLWNNIYIIGFDMLSGKVLYLKEDQDAEKEILIDLSGVAKCRIERLSKSSKNQKETVIYSLDLIFSFYDPAVPDKSLEFFNGGESICINGELPLIEKWQNMINKNLKGKPKRQ